MRSRRPTRRASSALVVEEEKAPLPAAAAAEGIRPATREETFPLALASVFLSFMALLVCYGRGYLLLYGDAVAHLGIARRILDSRNPGLIQLGGVWLPLPHLLLLPFVQKLDWWQNGLAGAWLSLLCYIVSVMGMYRLARRMMPALWALAATLFYALNPNLLYLATTAMTESLFLAILIWIVLLTTECVDAVRADQHTFVARRLLFIGLLIVAAVFTRYDGWILGAAVWCVLAWVIWSRPEVRRKVTPAFVVFTLLAVAGPLSWLAYNQHFYHDPLDFIRGPYSAAAIEKKTTPAGSSHYRGWHDPGWALLLYTRTAQIDAAAWEAGFAVLIAAIVGFIVAIRRRFELPALLLWLPLPFYVYSIAYGSVPIFIPPLWPHSYYNSRYGMEMLPAFAIFLFVAMAWAQRRWTGSGTIQAKVLYAIMLVLIAVNTGFMVYRKPVVLKEALANSTKRLAFEQALGRQLRSFPAGASILMYNSDFVGALQYAGIPLKQTVNEGDADSWNAALAAPATHAAYVVAIAGDAVSRAVASHPEGLSEMTVLCTSGQPCARVYQSVRSATSP
jgi:hypothetical protein